MAEVDKTVLKWHLFRGVGRAGGSSVPQVDVYVYCDVCIRGFVWVVHVYGAKVVWFGLAPDARSRCERDTEEQLLFFFLGGGLYRGVGGMIVERLVLYLFSR